MSPLAPPTQSITALSGSLFHHQGQVPRVVNTLSAGGLEAFPASPSGPQPMASGACVPARHFETVRMQYGEGTPRRPYPLRKRA